MEKNTQIVYDFVKKELEGVCSAHDMFHIERVFKLSKGIYEIEKKGDKKVILYSALLHEILDNKFFAEQIETQKGKIISLLKSVDLTEKQIEEIYYIIDNIGYGKSISGREINKTIEFQIVEDADRIESLGAITIARTFAYGGRKGREIYNPDIKPDLDLTEAKYGKSKGTSINHFYEKLLKLKYLMNTETGKK